MIAALLQWTESSKPLVHELTPEQHRIFDNTWMGLSEVFSRKQNKQGEDIKNTTQCNRQYMMTFYICSYFSLYWFLNLSSPVRAFSKIKGFLIIKSRCKSVTLPNRNREEDLNMLSDEFSEAHEKSIYLRQYKCGSNSRGCGNTWWGAEANNKCRRVWYSIIFWYKLRNLYFISLYWNN